LNEPSESALRRAQGPDGAPAARAALLCCLAAGFATLLDATIIAYTTAPVAHGLDAPTAGVQWFLAAYSLTFGLGLVPAGRLGDAFGRRGLLIAGLAIFLLGGIASALAPAVWPLVAGRLIQGLGAGFISAQVLGIIQDAFRGTARVQALGAYSAAGAAAAIAGPLAAGILLEALPEAIGWRVVLLTPVPFTIASIWLAARSLPRGHAGRVTRGLDLPGIALLGAIVVIVTLPVIDPGMPTASIGLIAAFAALLVTALALWERRYARRGRMPLFAPSLMHSPGFVAGNVVALLWFGSLIAFSTVTTVYFLQAHGISPFAVALVLVPASLARGVSSRVSHRLFLRLGGRVIAAGLVVEVAGVVLVLTAAFVWDGWALLIAVGVLQILLGAAGGIVEPPLRAITLGFASPGVHGVAASFLQLTQRLSATFFVALATGILLGGDASPAALRAAVAVCAAACLAALAVSWHPALRSPVLPAVSAAAAVAHPAGETVSVSAAETREGPARVRPGDLLRVDWHDERAAALREAMDAELGERYADRFSAFDAETLARFEADFALDPATVVATVVLLDTTGAPIGHAALRALSTDAGGDLEVKRVFVHAHARGTGASRALMAELERIAQSRGALRLILQTGDRQPDAVGLYERIGYTPIPIFAPYTAFDFSLCYEKVLSPVAA